MRVLFRPTGFQAYLGVALTYFIRIYTTLSNVGRIQVDNLPTSALLYHRIEQTEFYYYETQTSNDTHLISAFDPDVVYSVCCIRTLFRSQFTGRVLYQWSLCRMRISDCIMQHRISSSKNV